MRIERDLLGNVWAIHSTRGALWWNRSSGRIRFTLDAYAAGSVITSVDNPEYAYAADVKEFRDLSIRFFQERN